MPSIRNNISSWWSGTTTPPPNGSSKDHDGDDSARNKMNDSENGEFQTPQAIGSRRRSTRSQNNRDTKRRKTASNEANEATAAWGSSNGEGSTSLKQIATSLRMYHAKIEERQKHAEEWERKVEARAQRIESLLKKVLTNQKKLLSQDRDDGDDDDDDGSVESDLSEEEEESPSLTPIQSARNFRGVSSGRRPWSTKERKLCAMGIALFGKDSKALAGFLDDRNRNQINGFLTRNWDSIERDSKKWRPQSEDDKAEMFDAMKELQEADDDDDEEDEDGDDNDGGEEDEDEDESDDAEENKGGARKVKAAVNQGTWTEEEREQLLRGIAVHGKNNPRALSSFVKTRSPDQTRMYVYRHLKNYKGQN